jgi:hypothetical protein
VTNPASSGYAAVHRGAIESGRAHGVHIERTIRSPRRTIGSPIGAQKWSPVFDHSIRIGMACSPRDQLVPRLLVVGARCPRPHGRLAVMGMHRRLPYVSGPCEAK